jgi:hypothetical protein
MGITHEDTHVCTSSPKLDLLRGPGHQARRWALGHHRPDAAPCAAHAPWTHLAINTLTSLRALVTRLPASRPAGNPRHTRPDNPAVRLVVLPLAELVVEQVVS